MFVFICQLSASLLLIELFSCSYNQFSIIENNADRGIGRVVFLLKLLYCRVFSEGFIESTHRVCHTLQLVTTFIIILIVKLSNFK